jgi:hypothetical protein
MEPFVGDNLENVLPLRGQRLLLGLPDGAWIAALKQMAFRLISPFAGIGQFHDGIWPA